MSQNIGFCFLCDKSIRISNGIGVVLIDNELSVEVPYAITNLNH